LEFAPNRFGGQSGSVIYWGSWSAYLRNGLGSMPSYRATLTDAQIEALARYVSKASGGAP
jgi:mono/diheme cytochrome c family protein